MRGARGPILALLLAGLALPGLAPTAAAQTDPAATARAAAEALRAAGQSLVEAETARDRVAALSETVRAYERGLEALREGMRRAVLREQAIGVELDARRTEIARLLGVLTGMQRSPEALVLLHPSGPLGTARAGMMLGDVTPAMQAEADALRARLEEVALMRALQQDAADRLAEGLAGVQRARTELSQAMSDRRDLPMRYAANPEAMRAILEGSDSLDSFAASLPGLSGPGAVDDPLADFEAVRGTLPLPAEARIVRRFGEADAAGIARPGLVLATRPLALVSAPVPATIRYGGPLLDYGNVIVLEPAEGYLMVLAGLAQVYGSEGQVVPAGSPLGLMGGADPKTEAFLDAASDGGGDLRTETLYMELRQGGSPVDPEPWFAHDKD